MTVNATRNYKRHTAGQGGGTDLNTNSELNDCDAAGLEPDAVKSLH